MCKKSYKWLELSENVMAVDKHFKKDIEMLQMT